MIMSKEIKYFPTSILWVFLLLSNQTKWREVKKVKYTSPETNWVGPLLHTSVQVVHNTRYREEHMAEQEVEDLVVHLDKSMDLSTTEHGVELVEAALVNKNVNKWGIRSILKSSWKEFGELEIKWVKDNMFIITVHDKSTMAKISASYIGQ